MKQPNKNDYFINVDGTEVLPYDKAYRAYKEYADELEDYINHLKQAKNESLHLVSDYKKLNIHECLNDLEKVIEIKTGVLHFIDKGSLRYQLKKAIDKMICCR